MLVPQPWLVSIYWFRREPAATISGSAIWKGVVSVALEKLMDRWKSSYAQDTTARTLEEIIPGADVFVGLSAGGVLKPEMVAQIATLPLIMALANPTPEILPSEAFAVRPDAMICTGRSDYPNQVNNVCAFPTFSEAHWM